MKTFKTLLIASFLIISQYSFAQSTQEKFKVSGECGMCKTSIEKAAKSAGATFAEWNSTTKELLVKYESTTSNTAKIQQNIAKIGYDNAGYKATTEAYNKLHECCKYERVTESTDKAKAESCCQDAKCKDGKCDHQNCKTGECKHDSTTACCKKV